MKRFFVFFLIILTFNAFGQDYDQMMVRKQVDCADIAYNCGLYAIKYIKENKADSLNSLMDYWTGKCGMREPIFRLMVLRSLQKSELYDSLLRTGFLNNILNYESRMDMIKYSNYFNYEMYKSYYGYIPPGEEFDNYTREMALSMKSKFDPSTAEYLLCEFYGDNSDTLLPKLQLPEYRHNSLSTEYYKVLAEYLKKPEFHFSWITGMWIPTGDLKKMGVHPDLGFQVGAKHHKMNYDVTLTIKFAHTPDYYYARRSENDTMALTNYFFGGYIGLDIGRDLFMKNGNEIQLTGGIGYDGFDTFDNGPDNELEAGSVSSYNFNIGLGYRHYFKDVYYVGFRAKYNFVDYTLQNIIDFTGNTVTVQFIIGTLGNKIRNDNLKALKYKIRN